MSLYTISKRLTGVIPETPLSLAQDAVLKALGFIYDGRDWSFQRGYAGWLAPGILFQTGTVTTTPYSLTIICDATTTALLAAYASMPLITQLQFRNPGYSVYNIVGYDNGADPVNSPNYPFATLTLDRPWMEPTSGPGQPYMIYQVYFVAPVQDFRKFLEIRDTTNDQPMDFFSKTQAQLAVDDPQRQDFSIPRFVVPAGIDNRPGTATPGWQMFELWPHQGNYVPYSYSYLSRGPLPAVTPDWMSMGVPYPLTEEMVEWRARELLCQFKEGQKDHTAARGSGANWVLLSQMAEKEYKKIFDVVLDIDLNLYGEAFTRTRRQSGYPGGQPFATMNGQLNLGGYRGT